MVDRVKRVNMHYHAKFFSNWSKWQLSTILYFQKVGILTVNKVETVKVHQHAKFHGDQSNRYRDMAIFRFFKNGAVCHLDLLCTCLVDAVVSILCKS